MSRRRKPGKQAKPVRRAPKPIGGRVVQDFEPLSVPTAVREQAQRLSDEALGADSPERRIELTMEALSLDPYCSDALVLSVRSCEDPELRRSILAGAVAAAQLRLGDAFIARHSGSLWEQVQARSYLVALMELAIELDDQNQLEQSVLMLESALTLNLDDHQGARYLLLGQYLALGRLELAGLLLDDYEEPRATFRWGRVLERFLAGDLPGASAALVEARKTNRFFEDLVLGRRDRPSEPPEKFYQATAGEADNSWFELRRGFERHPEFAQWLATQPVPEPVDPATMNHELTVDPAWRARYREIVALTDPFCAESLTLAFAQSCRKMAAQLCQPGSPVGRGQVDSWAASVVAAIARVNLMGSKDPDFGFTHAQLGEAFGVGASTIAAKLRVIRDCIVIADLHPEWTPTDLLIRNPRVWLLLLDGLLIDLRDEPRDVQERAVEQGIIPFVPEPRPGRIEDLGGYLFSWRLHGELWRRRYGEPDW